MARPRRPRDPIVPVGTSAAAFVGSLPGAPPAAPVPVTSVLDFESAFGSAEGETADAVWLFFENGGRRAYVTALDEADPRRSLDTLASETFDVLVIPATARLPEPQATSLAVAAALFAEDKRAFYLVDPPAGRTEGNVARWAGSFGGGGSSAVYLPRLQVRRSSGERDVPAAGAVAGILGRTDIARGVWVSCAGGELTGLSGRQSSSTTKRWRSWTSPRSTRSGAARPWNPGLECAHPGRHRLRVGAHPRATICPVPRAEHRPRPARGRLRAQPPRLWTQVRAQVRTFLHAVFRQGAFPAATPEEAFFVRCDRTTMTQDDIDSGRLVIHVGIAPIRPAEFVLLRIGLWARADDED
jgi:hypothetical protein